MLILYLMSYVAAYDSERIIDFENSIESVFAQYNMSFGLINSSKLDGDIYER